MNNTIKILLLISLLSGCAILDNPKQVKLKFAALPAINIDAKEFYTQLTTLMNKNFGGVGVINQKRGLAESAQIVKEDCWAGLIHGGMIPCEKAQLRIEVDGFNPLDGRIAVEILRSNYTSNYQYFVPQGNDVETQARLISELRKLLMAKNSD